jgi:hypothetical protein
MDLLHSGDGCAGLDLDWAMTMLPEGLDHSLNHFGGWPGGDRCDPAGQFRHRWVFCHLFVRSLVSEWGHKFIIPIPAPNRCGVCAVISRRDAVSGSVVAPGRPESALTTAAMIVRAWTSMGALPMLLEHPDDPLDHLAWRSSGTQMLKNSSLTEVTSRIAHWNCTRKSFSKSRFVPSVSIVFG